MLDALKQPHGPRVRFADEPSKPRLSTVAEDDLAALDGDEEMPFIEVGGPRPVVALSPAAPSAKPLKVEPPPVPQPEAPVLAPLAVAKPSADRVPWKVQFRPYSVEASTGWTTVPRPVQELIAFHQPEHAVSEQYRTLLADLMAHMPPARGRVLLFTAPAPWTGTTTVLLNLAVTAARQEERRVAVVDANLRRPALAERLGLMGTPGLRDVLAGSVPLARALQATSQVRLWALAAGRSGSSEARLPLDWWLPTLRQLREQFDLVFVDAPSWNEGSEVSALAATCDAVYVVLHQKEAVSGDQRGALPGLRQPPSNLQGSILTMR
jgi:Mrp family chromosome partitioning ATPase